MANAAADRAIKLELDKRYKDAGEAWLEAGRLEKALFNFERAGATTRAIDAAVAHGDLRRAAEMCLASEAFERAGELFEQMDDPGAAAKAYQAGGFLVRAATVLEQSDDWVEAAHIHESLGDFMRAGVLLERAGDANEAARVYELALNDASVSRLGSKSDIARIAGLLTQGGNFDRAAQLYLVSNQVAEAVGVFVQMGEIDGATKLLLSCQHDVGNDVLNSIDFHSPHAVDFARAFYMARDYQRAAQVFERLGEHSKAAYLFEKCQDFQHGAQMRIAAGDKRKAAELFEQAGSFLKAASLFLEVEDTERAAACFEAEPEYYQAGRLYSLLGRTDKALQLLQQVKPTSPDYGASSLAVARILREKGQLEVAILRQAQTLEVTTPTRGNIEAFFDLGCMYQEAGRLEDAQQAFQTVLRLDPDYRDAAARYQQLATTLKAAETAQESAHQAQPPPQEPAPRAPRSALDETLIVTDPEQAVQQLLRTLLLTDLVNSTRLVEALGDERAAAVFARHDRVARDLLPKFEGREIDKTDGFLLIFRRPLEAVRYALAYHKALAELSIEMDVDLKARAGIHLGEVFIRRNPERDVALGAKPIELEGLAKPAAARLMSLALPGQTLVSRVAHELGHRAARADSELRWISHGYYDFKGVSEPTEVLEVGIEGQSPLQPPVDTEKAQRTPQPSAHAPTTAMPASPHPTPAPTKAAADARDEDAAWDSTGHIDFWQLAPILAAADAARAKRARRSPGSADEAAGEPLPGAPASSSQGSDDATPEPSPKPVASFGGMEGFEAFSSVPLFQNLTLGELKRLWASREKLTAAADSVILEEDVDAIGLYIIVSGSCAVVKHGEAVTVLQPGEFFGEMALMDADAMTSARIVATENAELFLMPRESLRRLMIADVQTALKLQQGFVEALCERLRRATSEISDLRRRAAEPVAES